VGAVCAPSGPRPERPAWYAAATVAYVVELGYDVAPVEAFWRRETGAYLDPRHGRLKDAYVATLADLGVPVGKDIDERAFLEAMEQHKQVDPPLACVLSASSPRSRAASANSVSGRRAATTATVSAGRRWSARRGGRTSGPR
jgi:hypothetical protein